MSKQGVEAMRMSRDIARDKRRGFTIGRRLADDTHLEIETIDSQEEVWIHVTDPTGTNEDAMFSFSFAALPKAMLMFTALAAYVKKQS